MPTRPSRKTVMLILPLLLALIFIVTSTSLEHSKTNITGTGGEQGPCENTALIADGLANDFPNPELIDKIADMLRKAGYRVEIYTGEQVDLNLYSRLTEYKIVILRIHGGKAYYTLPNGEKHVINGLFTGVEWTKDYEPLKREWIATRATPYYPKNKSYVAVLPRFFETRLEGSFCPDTVIIAFGCYTLLTTDIPRVLISHGLHAYIGWIGPVTVDHMDRVLLKLVEEAVLNNLTWKEAVKKVNEELGPDPYTGEYLYIATSMGGKRQ